MSEDNHFSHYEGYFNNTTFQLADISANLEPHSPNHYFNSISDELQNHTVQHQQPRKQQQQQQPQLQSLHPMSTSTTQQLPPLIGLRQTNQPHQKQLLMTTNPAATLSLNSVHSNNLNGNASIPFVRIHTTNAQPSKNNFSNIFRRNQSHNDDEIKSEPIKSENSDVSAAKENHPIMPVIVPVTVEKVTPPPSSSTSAACSISVGRTLTTQLIQNKNAVSDSSASSNICIHKCNQCLFISLSLDGVNNHRAMKHASNFCTDSSKETRTKMLCPGCDNIFYAQNSLEIHLLADHLMSSGEATVIITSLMTQSNSQTQQHNDDGKQEQQPERKQIQEHKKRKSRIYLKNVECLREPRQDNSYSDSFAVQFPSNNTGNDGVNPVILDATCDNSGVNNTAAATIENQLKRQYAPPKQKISIKSVDVLREPALLRRDAQQMQSFDFVAPHRTDDDDDSNKILELPDVCSSNRFTSSLMFHDEHRMPTAGHNNDADDAFEKPRCPKIYIRNVDILKEPLILPSNNQMNLLNVSDDLHFNLFPSTTISNDMSSSTYVDSSATHIPSSLPAAQFPSLMGNLADDYLFDDDNIVGSTRVSYMTTSLGNFSMPPVVSPEYQAAAVDTSTFQQALAPQEQHKTQKTQQKSKIFIKNVDILKQPQFQENRRRMTNLLHLRTVDELNLMNKNDVENLIAPNLDGGLSLSADAHLLNHSGDNSKNSEDAGSTRRNTDGTGDYRQLLTNQVFPNNWTNEYVLEELNCIIDSNSNSISGDQKHSDASQHPHYDLNTPHMSVVSISDEIGEATDQEEALPTADDSDDAETLFVCAEELINANNQREVGIVSSNASLRCNHKESCEQHCNDPMDIVEILDDLKREQQVQPQRNANKCETVATPSSSEQLVVDAVVISRPLHLSDTSLTTPTVTEKGRIYVSENLMEIADKPSKHTTTASTALNESVASATVTQRADANSKKASASRGRPFGSNRTGITKIRKTYGSASAIDVGTKCDINGCAFRFKKSDTLEYHKKCHNSNGSPQLICPECQSTNFSNWNTLHTHLWRSHTIDMELYSCELCNFKTPIYSRLINTHSKIHSDERNYKCDQCEKAFKNSKQLKNHRRWHRTTAANSPAALHSCRDCGSAFSHLKSLREHICKDSDFFRCSVCSRALSSKSSLKLHMLTHEAARKFKCSMCDYMANDHNAFRRHKMKHENNKMYICSFCDYKSIQSAAYQRHIQLKHPDSAEGIIHKCTECSFATINRALLNIHVAKHKQRTEANESCVLQNSHSSSLNNGVPAHGLSETGRQQSTCGSQLADRICSDVTETNDICLQEASPQLKPLRNKIKVKSDLVLTDPTKFSNNVNPLMLHCFDDAIT